MAAVRIPLPASPGAARRLATFGRRAARSGRREATAIFEPPSPFGRGTGAARTGLMRFLASYRSRWSAVSVLSLASVFSVLSIASVGSILSIGSAGSILSIGSAGSILSIGSAGSIGSIGAAGALFSIAGRRRERPQES